MITILYDYANRPDWRGDAERGVDELRIESNVLSAWSAELLHLRELGMAGIHLQQPIADESSVGGGEQQSE